MNRIKVLHTNGEIEDFKPRLIGQTIIKETGINEEIANRIQSRITSKINKLKKEGLTEISTGTIRSEVSSQLLKEREFGAEKKNRKLGMSVQEFEDLMTYGCKDNANISYSPEMIAKYAYDSIAKEYALLDMPKECAEYHINGICHHHDCEYMNTRPNCMNYDLRFIAKNGLKIDGKGLMGSVAGPAKSLEVLLNHLLQAWMAGATVFSGGQGLVNFNTLLAPFAKNRDYKSIKQAIQGFVFNCNMSLICRGGQVLFSSIALDLSIPDLLKNKPAIGPNGVVNGVYGDYQQEADMIFKAVCEVLDEKDFNGAYHRFPNCVFNIREGDLDKYEGNAKLLSELGANNPTIYYVNNANGLERTVMGCFDGDTKLWCKINNNLTFISFKELSNILNADYGVTDLYNKNIEVLTIDDNRKIIWHKASNFIKNKDRLLYKVSLPSNKSFICDDTHTMITAKGLNRKNILDCNENSNLLDVNCKNIKLDINKDKKYWLGCLYGFWMGDGSKVASNGSISMHKEDKKEYVENILNNLNLDYNIYTRNSEKISEKYSLDNYLTYNFTFDKKIFDNIEDNYDNLNFLAGIISGCISSDGYVRTNGKFAKSLSIEWVSTNQEYIDIFKYALFNCGIIYSSRKINNDKKNEKEFERVYLKCNNSTSYLFNQLYLREKQKNIVNEVIDISYKDIKETKGTRIKNIELIGKGDSYCLEVNGRIIVTNDFILTGQCRTALPMNFTGDYEKDCCNTGNFMYTTLNLPLIALNANGNEEEFYKQLDKACEVAYKGLIHRRETVIDTVYNKHMSDFLLQKDKDTGEPLWDIDRTTITIGFCGLNECLYALYGIKISEDTEDKGVEIINFLNDKKEEFHKRDGLRWSVIASAAESTAHRFAEIIKEKYPDAYVQGTPGNYYLTNSSHIPVCEESNIIEHIKNADKYHPITTAGNILHIWLGEVWSDPKALWKLNQKIIKTGTVFWAYSKVFTYCNECGFSLNDNLDECPICKSKDVTTYDRVTGYYLPTNGYNNGKKQEFKDRYRHKNLA